MVAKSARVLSVAVRSGRLGYIVLSGHMLIAWGTSEKGAKSVQTALGRLERWVQHFEPLVLITEDPNTGFKGERQRTIIRAFGLAARDWPLMHKAVKRKQRCANLYEDVAHVAAAFPELAVYVPKKPKIWNSEPYRLVYFEALILARDAGFVEETDAEGAASFGE